MVYKYVSPKFQEGPGWPSWPSVRECVKQWCFWLQNRDLPTFFNRSFDSSRPSAGTNFWHSWRPSTTKISYWPILWQLDDCCGWQASKTAKILGYIPLKIVVAGLRELDGQVGRGVEIWKFFWGHYWVIRCHTKSYFRVPYREDTSFITIVLVAVKAPCITFCRVNSLQKMGAIFQLQVQIFIFVHTICPSLYESKIAIFGLYDIPMIIHELCGLALVDLRAKRGL